MIHGMWSHRKSCQPTIELCPLSPRGNTARLWQGLHPLETSPWVWRSPSEFGLPLGLPHVSLPLSFAVVKCQPFLMGPLILQPHVEYRR